MVLDGVALDLRHRRCLLAGVPQKLPERLEHEGDEQIAARPHDHVVEGDVGVDEQVDIPGISARDHLLRQAVQFGQVLVRTSHRCKPRRADLDNGPCLQQPFRHPGSRVAFDGQTNDGIQ